MTVIFHGMMTQKNADNNAYRVVDNASSQQRVCFVTFLPFRCATPTVGLEPATTRLGNLRSAD